MTRKKSEKIITNLILENQKSFYRLAYRYVNNPDDALDIIQESIYKAMVSVESLDDLHKVKSWFYRIVINTSLDFLRKQKRIQPVEEEQLELFAAGSNDEYPNIDLEKAVDNLPSKYKHIIVLRYLEDLKIEEVADVLEENVNTIKTRLYKALQLLRLSLEAEQTEGVRK